MGKNKGSPAPAEREHRDLGKVTDTEWPEACPSKYEENVISILCGNTHLNWGLHLGSDSDFTPNLFWRTPALTNEEIQAGDPCAILERYLPPGGHELVFGGRDSTPDKTQAAKAAAERRIPTLGVYVVSTNRENEAGIEFLFREIPCRIYRLKASDFYPKEGGGYEGIGIDRLSNLKAASNFYKLPLIVFDGGTAMTYTAANAKGDVLGGGIYPGCQSMYRAMHDYTGALPLITHDEWKKAIDESSATQTPLSLFADNTKGGMIAPSLKAMAEVCWGAIEAFKAVVLEDRETNGATDTADDMDVDKDKDDEDRLFTVCVTGGDGNVISQLLEPDHSGIVPSSGRSADALTGIDIQKHKHLCHYGVQHVLKEKCSAIQTIQSEDDGVRNEIRGQRVAKKFKIGSEEKIFRGSVAAIAAGKTLEDDWFYVRYDDGDTEHLSITGLYDALTLYREIGEDDPDAAESAKTQRKMEEAKETATLLESKSATVKKHSELPVAQRGAGRKRAAGTATKSAPPAKVAKTKSFSKKQDPNVYVNMRVAKFFGDELYFGTITHHVKDPSGDLWHVLYDDEDSEDYDAKDLKKSLNLYKTEHVNDKKSRVTAVAAAEEEDEDDDARPAAEEAPAEAEPVAAEAPEEDEPTAPEAPADVSLDADSELPAALEEPVDDSASLS